MHEMILHTEEINVTMYEPSGKPIDSITHFDGVELGDKGGGWELNTRR